MKPLQMAMRNVHSDIARNSLPANETVPSNLLDSQTNIEAVTSLKYTYKQIRGGSYWR